MHQFYGVVIDRASDFSATLDVAAHEAKFLRYPWWFYRHYPLVDN